MNRRAFLSSAAAATLLAARPGRARAASSVPRKFIFVFNSGGWDPTRTFAPLFDNSNVAMESQAVEATAGGLRYVDHPDRPSVRSFFQEFHSRSLVLNGILVPAVSHELCTTLSMTARTAGTDPDWPAILASAYADRYTLPHLVIAGPSYSGPYSALVVRAGANSQLDYLLSASGAQQQPDISVPTPDAATLSVMDRYVNEVAAARLKQTRGPLDAVLAGAFEKALEKASALRDLRDRISFGSGSDYTTQNQLAANTLSLGLTRCVTLVVSGGSATRWDSHSENDPVQSELFELLFAGLNDLMLRLETTPGEGGGSLADETVVVVLSEMGRSPSLNALDGKDHWPYTSALLVGPGLTGDRVVGGFDEYYRGSPVDTGTGELSSGGVTPSVAMLGATLLALGGLDPADHVSDAPVLDGVLR